MPEGEPAADFSVEPAPEQRNAMIVGMTDMDGKARSFLLTVKGARFLAQRLRDAADLAERGDR